MEILLNRSELINLGKDLSGVGIACIEGCCWITQAGDSRDHILTTGKGFEIDNSRHLVVTAMERCRLKLTLSGEVSSLLLQSLFRSTVSALHWT